MKEIKLREIELLAKVCNRNDVPLKLGKLLLKTAENHTYENNSQSIRIKEYQALIDIHFNGQQR